NIDAAEICADIREVVAELFELQVHAIVLIKTMSIPKTSSGKIQRKGCKAAFIAGELKVVDQWQVDVAELGAQEELLAGAHTAEDIEDWLKKQLAAQLRLKCDQIAKDVRFTRLGLSSLVAMQLIGALEQWLGQSLSLSLFSDYPTITALSSHLAKLPSAHDQLLMPKISPDLESEQVPFDLNTIQKAYWYGRQDLYPLGQVSCHLYFEMLVEDVDVARLSQAWNMLIQQHGMLRTVIDEHGQQTILSDVPEYQIKVADCVTLDKAATKLAIERLRQQLSHQVLESSQWPLFDIQATAISKRKTLVHISYDLLIMDMWSIMMLSAQWGTLYENPAAELKPLSLSFRDYLLTEQSIHQGRCYQEDWHYWVEQLNDLPPPPQLPFKTQPTDIKQSRFLRHEHVIPDAAWGHLKTMAASHDLTPSMLLCTAFAEVLALWSKSPRFTLNLTIFNRLPLHDEVDDLVGDFTSLLLLAVKFKSAMPFLNRAQQLQKQLYEALDHRLVNAADVLREQQSHPGGLPVVFTSALGLQAQSQAEIFPSSWLGKRVYTISQTPQVWLDHQVVEEKGNLILSWDVVQGLFADDVITDMFSAYIGLLSRLSKSDVHWQQTGCYGLPKAQQALRERINDTSESVPAGYIHSPFMTQSILQPEHVAIEAPGISISYQQLYSLSTRLSHKLMGVGAKPNHLVAIMMEKGWEQVVACLATSQAGTAYLPINPSLPKARIDLLLEQGDVAIVLTQPKIHQQYHFDDDLTVVDVTVENIAALPDYPLLVEQDVHDLAYVIFTSGSTGQPKGVMMTQQAVLNTLQDINDRHEVGPADKVLALSSLSFDLSVWDIFGTLGAGGTIVIPDSEQEREPKYWAELIQSRKITVWNSAPAMMKMLLDYQANGDFSSLRLVMLSGDWIPVTMPDRIWAVNRGIKIVSLGGATEAAIWSIEHVITQSTAEFDSIPYGLPLTNQQMYVLNEAMKPCPDWVTGSLYIGGIGLASGYWKDRKKTEHQFIVHPETGQKLYRTGDLGRWLPSGDIEFLGRDDAQVKIRGYRIELGEIEATLAKLAGVEDGIVKDFTDEQGQKYLVGFLVTQLDIELVKQFLQDKLPIYMVPLKWVQLSELPLNNNGKVDRSALVAPESDQDEQHSIAPRNKIETWLQAYWQTLLNRDHVSLFDHFFQLGGDSITATQVVSAIKRQFNIDVSLKQFFEHCTTVEQLGHFILQQTPSTVVALPQLEHAAELKSEPFALNPIQHAYWLGRHGHYDLGQVACHFYTEIDVHDLNLERLERAWQILIQRHDMLRVVFSNDGLKQQVQDDIPNYQIEFEDLTPLSEVSASRKLRTLREALSEKLYDTTVWPLFDVKAQQIDAKTTRIYLSFDLLIADVWSFLVLSKEWQQLYNDLDVQLPALTVTFSDYVRLLPKLEASKYYEDAWQYWLKRCETLPAAPELPLACAPSEIEKPRFERFKQVIPAAQWSQLKQRAKGHQVTPSMVVCTVFSQVLATWSRSSHFTLNLTLFNRLPVHDDVMSLVGDFTSLLLLEVNTQLEESFIQRVHKIQSQLLQDIEHRAVNGIDVIRQINKQANHSQSALMPVVFTSALPIQEVDEQEGFPFSWLGDRNFSITQTPQVWLDHQVFEEEGALHISWDVVEGLFPDNLIEDMFAAYNQLLEQLCAFSATWQEKYFGLLPEYQYITRKAYNNTTEPLSTGLLYSPFLQQVDVQPDAIAIISEQKTLTYQQLEWQSSLLAEELSLAGASRNQLIAVVMEKGWEQALACLAITRAGAAYLPIDPSLPSDRVRYLLKSANVRQVLTQSWLLDQVNWPSQLHPVVVDQWKPQSHTIAVTIPPHQPTDLAYVIYTSGSTGQPKGVMMDHKAVLNTVEDIIQRYVIDAKDRFFALSNLNFDLSVFDLFGCLAAGACLVIPNAKREREPSYWVEQLVSHKVTVWNSV
ncbi:MAG: amino acid adenylation domain-containing protein, partial [Methylococcales bacterium]|nr:amino acid adenylation domain-containing protein [Methylococcales bacterium]